MANNDGYNGFSNYETWAVNLWLSNDEGSSSYWQEVVDELREEHMKLPEYLDDDGDEREPTDEEKQEAAEAAEEGKRDAINELAERLESEHEDAKPEVTGVFSDLLTHALGRVDWREIATSLFEE